MKGESCHEVNDGLAECPLNHADWSHKLSEIEYAMNNSVHSRTKVSPSQLLFGVAQRGDKIDVLTEYLDAKAESISDRNLDDLRADASAAIVKSQKYNENLRQLRSEPTKTYERGD